MLLLFLLITLALALLKLWELLLKLLLLPTQFVLNHLTIELAVLGIVAVRLSESYQILD